MAEEMNGNPLAEDQNSPSGSNQDNNIPDWMRDAGWENDTGSFDESKPVFDDLEGEYDIVPAEIPAWLEEAAPEGFNLESETSPTVDGSPDKESIQALLDDDFISPSPENEPQAGLTDPDFESAEIESDPAEESELDVPSWLENLKYDEDSQETAVAWLENMPESLRATEEELEQARMKEPRSIEEPEDELAWMDEVIKPESESLIQAELSEDLVAADLLPENQSEDKLYATEELKSFNTDDSPEWLNELGNETEAQYSFQDESPDQDDQTISEQIESSPVNQQEISDDVNLLPDWLLELGDDEEKPDPELSSTSDKEDEPVGSEDIPDWLGDFESLKSPVEPENDSSSLAWLESLAENQGVPEEQLFSTPEEREQASPPIDAPSRIDIFPPPGQDPISAKPSPSGQMVSPTDDTLNTEIPEWLSKIGEIEEVSDEVSDEIDSLAEDDDNKFEETASWLEQLEEQPTGELQQEDPAHNSEVMDWLEGMNDSSSPEEQQEDLAVNFREAMTSELDEPQTPIELETAKYMPKADDPGSLPDWLSELDSSEDDEPTLESALRRFDHPLSTEEQDYLEQNEEIQEENADWLAKLDLVDDQLPTDSDFPAIKVDVPVQKTGQTEEESTEEIGISGGILDRLKDTGGISKDPVVPQWLENLKKEEDPQETAILWLKQFVEQGDQATLSDQIKRYTDELNPGDTIPAWMEDLKNEEDPQTTAMLWLEKLSGERPVPDQPQPKQSKPDESDWLTALEKEEAEKSHVKPADPAEDFQDDSNGWLEDLDIDEKIKTGEDDLPDWINKAGSKADDSKKGEPPPWMKATSPLEGDFHTDELAGEEKKVEIPDWLAGYGEGEAPEDQIKDADLVSASPDPDEYAWVSSGDEPPKPVKEPIDLNTAAISQLEGILGVSYQVARGIIRYREQHGPYQDISDLLNVPEITDEQTIEILKPVVVIHEAKTKPSPTKTKKPQSTQNPEERLAKARSLMSEKNLSESLAEYDFLIKKKKFLKEVINDLSKAANDFPNEISVIKTLGDAYMKINNLEAALESYSKAEDLLR